MQGLVEAEQRLAECQARCATAADRLRWVLEAQDARSREALARMRTATITIDVSERIRAFAREIEQACQLILDAPDEQRDLVVARLRNGTQAEQALVKHYDLLRMAAGEIPETRIIAGVTPGWQRGSVYLDGEYVHGCTKADSAAGYVIVTPGEVTNGRWVPDYSPEPFKKFGSVRIEFRDAERVKQ